MLIGSFPAVKITLISLHHKKSATSLSLAMFNNPIGRDLKGFSGAPVPRTLHQLRRYPCVSHG